jgi:hypothetical protein
LQNSCSFTAFILQLKRLKRKNTEKRRADASPKVLKRPTLQYSCSFTAFILQLKALEKYGLQLG